MAVLTTHDSTPETDKATHRTHPGLCSVCRHGAECTYPKSRELPVWQCEEFEGIGPVTRPLEEGPPSDPQPDSRPVDEQYAGLCQTCVNRMVCTFPRPIGGVWHCEEFQ